VHICTQTIDFINVQVRRDWYIYAVLSTLPWVGRELYEKKEQALEHLITSIEAFLMKRTKNHHDALKVWISDTPHPQEEVKFLFLASIFSFLYISQKIYYCKEIVNIIIM
jgi:hypothetical protein